MFSLQKLSGNNLKTAVFQCLYKENPKWFADVDSYYFSSFVLTTPTLSISPYESFTVISVWKKN